MPDDSLQQKLAAVLSYHRRTKHHLDRYAAGPEFLDWASQPDPFRRFAGAPSIPLPLASEYQGPAYRALYHGETAPSPVNRYSLGILLRLSLGLAAWKQYGGSRWALRCNPSSGNLHPTEGYILTASVPDLDDGLFHYAPHEHALEQRCRFAPNPRPNGRSRLLIGLSSIAWREAWKYGERAFRYVQLDIGHAIAAICLAAATLGWKAVVFPCSDPDLSTLLGLDRKGDFATGDKETPDVLLHILTAVDDRGEMASATWVARSRNGDWYGRANPLEPPPNHRWPVIDEVSAATHADQPTLDIPAPPEFFAPLLPCSCGTAAAAIITGRRSAQAYDGATSTTAADFFRMLDVLLPRENQVPWDAWPHRARIHPILLVHRVDGLPSGIYALPRRIEVERELKSALSDEFEWSTPPGCPDGLPLFLLLGADARNAAKTLSCHQDIAADGTFSLGMLGEFDSSLTQAPWCYRHLYWEAGMLGQMLYLEAEAAGVRGTGIGCFFDDSFHQILGLRDTRFQSLYHFTVGRPLEDTRLQTLPAYGHLPKARQTESVL